MEGFCRVELLGGLRITIGDRVITRFQTQKTGALFGYLSLNPQTIHARETVAELLWPNSDPTAVRNRLNQAVSSLRRQVHPPDCGPDSIIRAGHHTLSLNAAAVSTDVADFLRHYQLAQSTECSEQRLRHYVACKSLYKGELLSGYFEDFLLSERIRLSELHLRALEGLSKSLVEAKNFEGALEPASAWVAADLGDEAAHVFLMKLYLKLGRPRSAIRQFYVLLSALEAEGSEPSPAALKLKLKAESMLEDGPQEIADFETQSESPSFLTSSPIESVMEVASDYKLNNLPHYFTKFLGRESEIEDLHRRIEGEERRIVTICGLGGCGKTRLAVEYANKVSQSNQDVLYVPLLEIESVDSLFELVRRHLGLDSAEYQTALHAITSHLAPRSGVIILDNFEQLLPTGGKEVQMLASAAPTFRIIITSRSPLDIDGETVFQLLPLSLPPVDTTDLAELAGSPSIKLFVDRAQSAKQDFQLTERTAEPITEIVQRLEGLPLAIELVATWARVLSPQQMLQKILRELDHLQSRRKDIPERHRSIEAVIQSSFSQLSADQRDVLLQISLLEGSVSLAAAKFLFPDVDIESMFANIERTSLIYAIETPYETRYQVYDSVRRFALRELSPNQAAECRGKIAAYFSEFASEVVRESVNSDYYLLEFDWPNIRAALNWLEKSDFQQFCPTVLQIVPFLRTRSNSADGIYLLKIALTGAKDPEVKARLQAHLASLLWSDGHVEEANAMISEALAGLDENSNPNLALKIWTQMALELHHQPDYEGAMALLERSLPVAIRENNFQKVEIIHRRMGNICLEQRRWDDAKNHYLQALHIARSHAITRNLTLILLTLVNYGVQTRQYEAASDWLHEVKSRLQDSPEDIAHSLCLANETLLNLERDELALAAKSLLKLIRARTNDWNLNREVVILSCNFFAKAGNPQHAAVMYGFVHGLPNLLRPKEGTMSHAQLESGVEQVRNYLGSAKFSELMTLGSSLSFSQICQQISETIHKWQSQVPIA